MPKISPDCFFLTNFVNDICYRFTSFFVSGGSLKWLCWWYNIILFRRCVSVTLTFNLLTICVTLLPKSSLSQMFFKIGVLKNFAIFTGKHLCWTLFLVFNRLQAWRPVTRPATRLWNRRFPVNIAKLLRKAFLYKTSGGCSRLPKARLINQ